MESQRTPFTRRSLLKLAGAGVGAAVTGSALAACGSGSGGTDSGKIGGQLSMATYSYTAGKASPLQKTLDAYQAKHSNVTFNMIPLPFNEFLNQEMLRLVGGNRSGVVQLDIGWLPTVAGLGVLTDVGAQASKLGFLDSALKNTQVGGKQLAFPWVTGSLGLIANREILDQAKVSGTPQTIEEFESVLTEIKGLGKDIIPYAAATKVGDSLKDFIQWMQAFGATVVSNRTITITDEPCVQALTWYKSMLDKGLIAPNIDRTTDSRPLYTQRRVGFYDDAIIAKTSLQIPASEKDLLAATEPVTRPTVGSNKSVSRSYGQALAVLSGGDVTTARDFAAFATADNATVLEYFKNTALPPTTEAASKSPQVANDPWVTAWTKNITTYAVPDPFWQFAQFAQLETLLGEQVEMALAGKVSPQQALQTAQDSMRQAVK